MPKNIRVSKEYKRLMALLGKSGLEDRDSRIYVANKILKKELDSFKELGADDVNKLIEVFESWEQIQKQRMNNGTLFVESAMILDFLEDKCKIQFR